MKRDDVRAVFPEATDEEVNRILGKFHAELNPYKSQLDELTGAFEALKAKSEGLETQLAEAQKKVEAGMTAEELLAQKEAQAAQRELEFTLKSNGLDARAIFVAAGIDAESIDPLVAQVTVEDAEAPKANAQSIVDMVSRQSAALKAEKEALEAQLADAKLKANPDPEGNQGGAVATWDDFAKLPVAEQLAMKQANPNIVKELLNK